MSHGKHFAPIIIAKLSIDHLTEAELIELNHKIVEREWAPEGFDSEEFELDEIDAAIRVFCN